jgi:hypothetical protein
LNISNEIGLVWFGWFGFELNWIEKRKVSLIHSKLCPQFLISLNNVEFTYRQKTQFATIQYFQSNLLSNRNNNNVKYNESLFFY